MHTPRFHENPQVFSAQLFGKALPGDAPIESLAAVAKIVIKARNMIGVGAMTREEIGHLANRPRNRKADKD